MASDSVTISSDEDICLDEWHFVTKSSISNGEYDGSTNDGDYSDDGSIEIIERETLPLLRSSPFPSPPPSPPLSPSNNSHEHQDCALETCDESEIKYADGEINPSEEITPELNVEESHENRDSQVVEDEVPPVENLDSETVDSATHCFCLTVDNQASVLLNYFSRKIFYSCMVAALASIVIHQYRDYLIDKLMSNVYRQNVTNSSPSALVGDAPTVVEPSFAPAEFISLSGKDFIFQNIDRDENVEEILRQRRRLVENIFLEYFAVYNYIRYVDNGVYALNVSELYNDRIQYYTPPPYDKFFDYLQKWENQDTKCDELHNIISAKLPIMCRKDSYVVIFLKRHQYLNMFENIFNALQIESSKAFYPDDNIVSTLSKKKLSNTKNSVDTESKTDDDDDSIRVQKPKVEIETLNEKPTVINSEVKNQKKFHIETELPIVENVSEELPQISPEYFTASQGENSDASKPDEDVSDTEAKLDKLIQEMKILLQKFEKEWRNFYRFQMFQKWKNEKCKNDLCSQESEISEMEKTNDVIQEIDRVNSTYGEKIYSDSISGFIYDTVPITDRWSVKMNAEKSKNADYYDKLTGEWILKLGKAREKFRKRYKHKEEKKRPEKVKEKKECDICKSYKVWLKQTHEKVKTNYKKIKTQMKSKFKKLSEDVKHNYEKLISSDWKHYAKSIFQRFRL